MRFDDKLAARIGEQFRLLRLRANKTQEDLAGDTGMHTNHISLVERGKRRLTIESGIKICNALGVKLSRVLADLDE